VLTSWRQDPDELVDQQHALGAAYLSVVPTKRSSFSTFYEVDRSRVWRED
jgi:hypothetical protein